MRRRFLAAALVLFASFAGMSALTPNSPAQPEWKWPEKSKNLKVLPKDTDAAKLRATMTGFSRALGIRCSHCHVGKEGQPLSTYDFASDDNPKKEVARGMLKMLASVNEQLEKIQPDVPDRVNMGCVTCHHGTPRPRTLTEELTIVYDRSGADSTIARYRALRAVHYGAGSYDFRQPTVGQVGRRALEKKDPTGAIALFQLNAEFFPDSPLVHNSLGEAYLAAGDTTKAIAEYERSRALDPRDQAANQALETLRRP